MNECVFHWLSPPCSWTSLISRKAATGPGPDSGAYPGSDSVWYAMWSWLVVYTFSFLIAQLVEMTPAWAHLTRCHGHGGDRINKSDVGTTSWSCLALSCLQGTSPALTTNLAPAGTCPISEPPHKQPSIPASYFSHCITIFSVFCAWNLSLA